MAAKLKSGQLEFGRNVVNFGFVGPFDYYNVKYQIDEYPTDSCVISPTAFLFL